MKALLIAAFVACLPIRTQAQLPDTPAARQLSGWLAAFNSGNVDSLRHFLAANAPPSTEDRPLQATRATMDFRARTGGFDFHATESSTATKLSALVQERASDRLARMVIEVAASAPYRIVSLAIAPASPPGGSGRLPRLSEQQLVAAVREKAAQEAAAGRFAGAIAISQNGRSVFESAYGLADRASGVKNTVDTRFHIGSMNKMFTAVAVLQLVQAGKVRLDAPLATYLPDYPNRDAASHVTIHQLLTHTGGTGDFFGPEYGAHRLELRTTADYVKRFGTRDLLFAPGSHFDYSNFGFILLGAVIERVSGTSYYDYVASHVFAPAGMRSTGSAPEDSAGPARAVGYMRVGATGREAPNTESLPYRGTSAGGGYSTVRDLTRFAAALREHRLLNAANTELLTTGKVNAGDRQYAYGFTNRRLGDVALVGHDGGAPGMNGELEIDQHSGYTVVVLANLDPPAAQFIADFITARMPAAQMPRQ